MRVALPRRRPGPHAAIGDTSRSSGALGLSLGIRFLQYAMYLVAEAVVRMGIVDSLCLLQFRRGSAESCSSDP